jgi:hypothetical protein
MRRESVRSTSAFTAIRPYTGWILIMVGIILEVLGWYGISGESVVARQLPYLASGSIPGAALMIVGTVVAVARSGTRTAGQVAELHSALLEPVVTDDAESAPEPALMAMPDGTTFHRASCALVIGKAEAAEVTEDEITARALRPCPVCEPDPG